MAFLDKRDTAGDAVKPYLPLVGKIPPSGPEYPMCRCQKCRVVFYAHLEIYPGPALCRQCNQDEIKAAKKSGRRRRT